MCLFRTIVTILASSSNKLFHNSKAKIINENAQISRTRTHNLSLNTPTQKYIFVTNVYFHYQRIHLFLIVLKALSFIILSNKSPYSSYLLNKQIPLSHTHALTETLNLIAPNKKAKASKWLLLKNPPSKQHFFYTFGNGL